MRARGASRGAWILMLAVLGAGCSKDTPGAVAPSITGPASPLPDAIAGTAITAITFAASGATPITWSVTSGAPPPGLSLERTTGRYAGTPTTAGAYGFTVTATNSAGSSSRPYTHAVLGPPVITGPVITGPASPLAAGTVGTPYPATTFTATGSPPISWSVSSGALPPGLSLDSATGLYGGTPTSPGSFTFTVTATNAAGSADASYTQSVAAPPPDATALLSNNRLTSFSTVYPAGQSAPVAITGLNAGDVLVSIDRRPQNGFLYGLGYNGALGTVQLYAVHPTSALAVPIGSPGNFSDASGNPVVVGAGTFGIDFNPTVDRVRVVTSVGQNFRINPNTGAPVDANPTATGIQMDGAIGGATTTVAETAYTNSAPNAMVTTQYTLDPASDQLCIQNPPNNGTQTGCLALTQAVDAVLGFDIPPGVDTTASGQPVASGAGIAVVRLAGQSEEVLARVDLISGAVTSLGSLGTAGVVGLALQQPTSTPMVGLSGDGSQLLRFQSASPSTVVTAPVGTLTAGEILIGVDWRPQTGQLFALGVQASADTATLYLVDPQTGSVSAVGTPGGISFVETNGAPVDLPAAQAGYGFDFNPTVDRLRVVTGNGYNLRINPLTGVGVDGNANAADGVNPDGRINGLPPGSTGVTAAAYTNSFGQPLTGGVTTQYVLDSISGRLYIQNPPNSGTVNGGVMVTAAGAPLPFTEVNGFDIPAGVRTTTSGMPVASGSGFAAVSLGGAAHLFRIDLVSGEATDLGGIGATGISGLAVGQVDER